MRWRRVDAVFSRALARPEAERGDFVARECAGDPWLAGAVRHLLEAVGESDAFWREAGRQRSMALRQALDGDG